MTNNQNKAPLPVIASGEAMKAKSPEWLAGYEVGYREGEDSACADADLHDDEKPNASSTVDLTHDRPEAQPCAHSWHTIESDDQAHEQLVKCRECGIEQTHRMWPEDRPPLDRIIGDIDAWLATGGPVVRTHLESVSARLHVLRGRPRPDAPQAELAPSWVDYEIDTDDVCTLDGFEGVCLTTGEISVSTGLRMSRETARTLADRLDALLRHLAAPPSDDGGWNDATAANLARMQTEWNALPKDVQARLEASYEAGKTWGEIEGGDAEREAIVDWLRSHETNARLGGKTPIALELADRIEVYEHTNNRERAPQAELAPCVMDAPGHPRCRCGMLSQLECGLCLSCATKELNAMPDDPELADAMTAHAAPLQSEQAPRTSGPERATTKPDYARLFMALRALRNRAKLIKEGRQPDMPMHDDVILSVDSMLRSCGETEPTHRVSKAPKPGDRCPTCSGGGWGTKPYERCGTCHGTGSAPATPVASGEATKEVGLCPQEQSVSRSSSPSCSAASSPASTSTGGADAEPNASDDVLDDVQVARAEHVARADAIIAQWRNGVIWAAQDCAARIRTLVHHPDCASLAGVGSWAKCNCQPVEHRTSNDGGGT